MNISMIRYILGYVLKIEGTLMVLPCITALFYREVQGWTYVFIALASLLIGTLLTHRKPASTVFYLKEGCIATSLSWIVLSCVGALPFVLTGEIPSFTDAFFETVSGFTTTGSSILSDVEALCHCTLLWRSFTHWIGGMGVLVFLLAIVPMSGGSHMNLMRAESPGPSVGKLVPKVKYTAQILYLIYIAMTVLQLILLLIGKMPLFDALCTAFGTAGTGGFGIKNSSIGGYSPYLQWITTIFMILFGVNFNFYYLVIYRQVKKAFSMEEVRNYFIIIFAAIGIVFLDISKIYETGAEALRHAAFQVGSIITTTGFATADFDLWSQTSKTVIVLLMFIGACAGSTGGGMKVSRIMLLFKTIGKELNSYMHPKSIKKIILDKKPVEHEVVRSCQVYLITYVIIFAISTLLLSLDGLDSTTNFTAVAATFNNIGPGLNAVGPTQNFGHFSIFSKWVLIFDMLAGRLELFPLLILFHPAIYKDTFSYVVKRSKFLKKHK